MYFAGFVWKRQYGDLANLSWVRRPNSGHQHGGHEPVHREPGADADADAVAVATAGAAAAEDGQVRVSGPTLHLPCDGTRQKNLTLLSLTSLEM